MSSNKQSFKDLQVKYTDFVPSNLKFTKMTAGAKGLISYIDYVDPSSGKNKKLLLQGPFIEMNQGGIPRNDEWHADEKSRMKMIFPLDDSIPEIKEFADRIKEIDSFVGSEQFKTETLGPKGSKYKYSEAYRVPMEQDEETKAKNKGKDQKLPYLTARIDTSYPDGKIKTTIFPSSLNEQGQRVRESAIDTFESIDDFAQYVPYKRCMVRPVLQPFKVWAKAANMKDPDYGISFKVVKLEVEITSQTSGALPESFLKADSFLDSDDDEEDKKTSYASVTKKGMTTPEQKKEKDVPLAPTKKAATKVESSDDDSSSDEEDEVVNTVTKKTETPSSTTKKTVSLDSSSDSESEEEVKPVKKSAPAPAPATTKTTKGKKASA